MAEKGWGTPTWPKKYGGGGLSTAEARVLQQEMSKLGVSNPITGMGPGMFGQTLLEYGNEEQKMLHLRVREQVLQESKACRVQPLQIIEKQRKWMLRPGERPEKSPEHQLEAVLRILLW